MSKKTSSTAGTNWHRSPQGVMLILIQSTSRLSGLVFSTRCWLPLLTEP
jgi:hypothetical protein